MDIKHYAFYLSNNENKRELISRIMAGEFIIGLDPKEGAVFSEIALDDFIKEEKRHGYFDVISEGEKVSLQKYSEGEKRKVLLSYIISKKPKFVIVDNILDNLDVNSQSEIVEILSDLSDDTQIIQIANRKSDILKFIKNCYCLLNSAWQLQSNFTLKSSIKKNTIHKIPSAYERIEVVSDLLIKFNNVNVSYDGIPVVKNICWEIKKNVFWQLIGPNGSGKSTLLSLISGDNAKAYGQDITLFGTKKGGGESVWELKKKIGYFTSEIKRGFDRRESIEKMILSGFFDSVGLYEQPSQIQVEITVKWLHLLGMYEIRKKNFLFLTMAQQRMILIARAMVKHPPLLILDEPTAGLDDDSVLLFTALINKICEDTETTILYVSHRKEKGLKPEYIFELEPSEDGAIGIIRK